MLSVGLLNNVSDAFKELFNVNIEKELISFQKTRKEFEGDLTFVVFPLIKFSKKSPQETAEVLGNYLVENNNLISSFNVIKGFLNLVISDEYWIDFFIQFKEDEKFGLLPIDKNSNPVIVEYSSPNTNKPLHLGHIRNNLLGWSVAEILKANGKKVIKTNLVNDRGIHICKSMLAWERWGEGETPESTKMKGDHFVGKQYVKFEKVLKNEVDEAVSLGTLEHNARMNAPIMKDAREMLKEWENGNKYTRKLWGKMNNWVYEGFEKTYKRMGVDFDIVEYESENYLKGKDIVEKSCEFGYLDRKEDNSIWADLTQDGLDEKLLLRADGTSVYMTQDIGTAKLRYEKHKPQSMIYVVGNEQDYHFNVLKLVLKKIGYDWADVINHLSYGMVELPDGKLKSREGKVVDADDLMDEMFETAKKTTSELGKIGDFSKKEAEKLFHNISMGALKYFILKVDPKKKMIFNPKESIDFNGHTGPFIQYTYARIQSVLRKAGNRKCVKMHGLESILPKEKELLKLVADFPNIVREAGEGLSPALVANYVYDLAKEYNQFYQEIPILKAESESLAGFRVCLSKFVGNVIKNAMSMLGIEVPDRM